MADAILTEDPVVPLLQCPFCARWANAEGSINHDGACEGLKSCGLNNLQLHIMKANAKHWFERYRSLQSVLFEFKEALERSHR